MRSGGRAGRGGAGPRPGGFPGPGGRAAGQGVPGDRRSASCLLETKAKRKPALPLAGGGGDSAGHSRFHLLQGTRFRRPHAAPQFPAQPASSEMRATGEEREVGNIFIMTVKTEGLRLESATGALSQGLLCGGRRRPGSYPVPLWFASRQICVGVEDFCRAASHTVLPRHWPSASWER